MLGGTSLYVMRGITILKSITFFVVNAKKSGCMTRATNVDFKGS